MSKPKILLIDDEEKIAEFIAISITAEGFIYLGANTGEKGLDCFNNDHPNLIILDLGLPDMDGIEVLSQLREKSNIPVLVLTARDQETEKIKLLDAGANDYLSKPFGIKELIVRVKVLLRDIKYEPIPKQYNFDNLIVKTDLPLIVLNNNAVHLTKKEHQLLLKLVVSPNVLIHQKKLLLEIWGESHQEDSHYLRVLMTHLRKKLNDDADSPIFIQTEPGIGYRFMPNPVVTS